VAFRAAYLEAMLPMCFLLYLIHMLASGPHSLKYLNWNRDHSWNYFIEVHQLVQKLSGINIHYSYRIRSFFNIIKVINIITLLEKKGSLRFYI